jgi:hypothetical protein
MIQTLQRLQQKPYLPSLPPTHCRHHLAALPHVLLYAMTTMKMTMKVTMKKAAAQTTPSLSHSAALAAHRQPPPAAEHLGEVEDSAQTHFPTQRRLRAF